MLDDDDDADAVEDKLFSAETGGNIALREEVKAGKLSVLGSTVGELTSKTPS